MDESTSVADATKTKAANTSAVGKFTNAVAPKERASSWQRYTDAGVTMGISVGAAIKDLHSATEEVVRTIASEDTYELSIAPLQQNIKNLTDLGQSAHYLQSLTRSFLRTPSVGDPLATIATITATAKEYADKPMPGIAMETKRAIKALSLKAEAFIKSYDEYTRAREEAQNRHDSNTPAKGNGRNNGNGYFK